MKSVLITGGSKRIGKELVLYFGNKGWNVVIHYNSNGDEADKLMSYLKNTFPDQLFYIIQEDFANGELAANNLFERLGALDIKIDVLINNASVFIESSLSESNLELFIKNSKINLEAPFFLMKNFYNEIGAGVIINILDTRINKNSSSHGIYSLSKKGLADLTKMAALEWAPSIRVNAVAPGPVLAPVEKSDEYFSQVINNTPLKRSVKLDNLLNSVYFLITNDSITGQIIYCDSGEHLL